MKLNAKLTADWSYKSPTGLTAKELHEAALEYGNYVEFLSRQLIQKEVGEIYQLEQLFRKSTQGFQPIKQFVGALTSLEVKKNLSCHINVFAYSFLKQAKNFDLLLPFDREQNQEFWQIYREWSELSIKLEKFECYGQNCSKKLAKQYLALRKIVSRSSARDEIKTLAALLISGPSTLKQVSEDLGLSYTLGQRTVSVFENISVVETRPGGIYAIATEALPVVIFCLRETCGIDWLSNLNI
ncbi:hypothetical protein [Pleurocapsa sp. PCC 7319]|uniref:hypothetical protein n=1 Tax=Pleurocapsa sp. PCC 7319 TaxID=118161 RepID=UPI0003495428|nr:hypothetical protein [Pleurocapsa sp. PCC 7319]